MLLNVMSDQFNVSPKPNNSEKENLEHKPVILVVDISAGWDTVSQAEIILEYIRKLPFYTPELLYSGFDFKDLKKSSSSSMSGAVFCTTEDQILDSSAENSPLEHALTHKEPSIAIYDPSKMKAAVTWNNADFDAFHLKDPSALLAVLKIVL